MSLNNVVSIPDYLLRLTELCNEIGRTRTPPLKDVNPSSFKHVAQARQITPSLGLNQILLFAVPQNSDFILTYINVRTLDFTNKLVFDELVNMNLSNSVANLFLKKNGTNWTPSTQSYLALGNRPLLMVATAGDLIGLITDIQGVNVVGSIEGFLAPADQMIATRLAPVQTTIQQAQTVVQGQTGGSGGANTNGVITVSNTPF